MAILDDPVRAVSLATRQVPVSGHLPRICTIRQICLAACGVSINWGRDILSKPLQFR